MRPEPPAELIKTLTSLELATPDQVRSVAPRVRRLARDLPLFESVWVDALSQARILTPFQAAEINAGRGDRLRIGSLVLCQKLASNGLGEQFIARDNQAKTWWRVLRISCGERSPHQVAQQLEDLLREVGPFDAPGLLPPRRVGVVEHWAWAACAHVDGVVAADWIAQHGRLTPDAVMEIARQMLPPLAAWENRGQVHGNLAARQLILGHGSIALPLPGVRGILRPTEGYARADLPPEAFDGLAPERVVEGTPPTTASDMFALGCLWWHLLTGRTPLAGGDALSKLRSAHNAKIADVRLLAPETPPALAEAIAACVQIDPDKRPNTFKSLAARLGEPSRAGKAALARCLQTTRAPLVVRRRRATAVRPVAGAATATWAVAATVAVLASGYFLSTNNNELPTASIGTEAPSEPSHLAGVEPVDSSPAATSTEPMRLGPARAISEAPPDLVLPADKPLRLTTLPLKLGQKVRGKPGQRPLLLVPSGGLTIDCDDVTFENIDFAWEHSVVSSGESAILDLCADRLTLSGCSFQAPPGQSPIPAAICWREMKRLDGRSRLPTGSLRLADCTFRNVAAAVNSDLAAAVRMEWVNCLHLGPGPLVRRRRTPRPDEPWLISLEHCTLRDSAAVMELTVTDVQTTLGETELRARECAFILSPRNALIEVISSDEPTVTLRSLQWTGEGSLLGGDATMAQWRQAGQATQPLPDTHLAVSGLVRSQVEFAGAATGDPDSSRLVRWQAPLQSLDPPGIGDMPLALPRLWE